jgi:hypothetical protein
VQSNLNREEDLMRKSFMLAAIVSAFAYAAPADASDTLARFDAGFGSHPLIAGGAPNTARGVAPGGIPWAIERLRARVRENGSITVRGEGLVLAGGDSVGTRGTVTHVLATFFCQPGNVGSDSPPAEISLGGNFEIRGQLNPPPVGPCSAPALLIRRSTPAGAPGPWFAGGTLSDRGDDD